MLNRVLGLILVFQLATLMVVFTSQLSPKKQKIPSFTNHVDDLGEGWSMKEFDLKDGLVKVLVKEDNGKVEFYPYDTIYKPILRDNEIIDEIK